MGAKKYFNDQFQVTKLYLEHETASDFYLSSLQNNRAAWPLLCVRTIIFLTCLGTVIWSAIYYGRLVDFKYWPIYLTHWGIVLNTVCSCFATVVSFMAYYQGPIDATFGLPWYVKAYWVSYNTAVPIAFFITVFYWTFLSALEAELEIDPALDVFIHAMNSVLMVCLVMTAQHPSYLLHFYHSFLTTIVYLAFTIIYYYAGGTDPNGEPWIYPNIDWSDPGPTVVMVVISAILLLVCHALVVCLVLLRDWCYRRYISDSRKLSL